MGTPKPGVWVVGSRLAFNDVQSTELLVGLSVLESSGGKFWNIEASRRIGDHWKLTLEGRIITGVSDNDPLESPFYPVRKDSFIMLELGYFY